MANYTNQIQYGAPLIGNVEPESGNTRFLFRGGKKGPTFEIPSFGVPSPGEDPNVETGYEFSSGIFQNN